jgi:hypothetical protein
MEESVLKAGRDLIQHLSLLSKLSISHAPLVVNQKGPSGFVNTIVAIFELFLVKRIKVLCAHYGARSTAVRHLGHALQESLGIGIKLVLEGLNGICSFLTLAI